MCKRQRNQQKADSFIPGLESLEDERGISDAENAALDGPHHGFGSSGGAKLFMDADDVRFDRAFTDEER